MARKRKRTYRRRRKTSKSIHLGHGFKLNISKSGVNVSGGINGARVSLGNKGLKTTLSVPGTDIRKTKTLVSPKDIFDSKDEKKPVEDKNHQEDNKGNEEAAIKKPAGIEKEEQGNTDKVKGQSREERLRGLKGSGNPQESLEPVKRLKLREESIPVLPWAIVGVIGLALSFVLLPLGLVLILVGIAGAGKNYFSKEGKGKRFYNEGVKAYESGNMELVLTKLQEAVRLDEKNKTYNRSIALLMMEEFEDYKGAKEVFKRLVDDNKSKRGKLDLAKCHIMLGESKLAIPYLEELLEDYRFKKQELLEVKYYLGQSYLDELEFKKAKDLLKQVAKEDASYLNVQRLLSQLEN